ncbi:isoprenyl transferase [Cerasicoccus arenae]|uniref:Isoprenyl transferase n=1 Tax=Cerasicoccus arenae TaxID=424488 RepID=A0A8J3GG36_9BACT|nr:isoprenyl transferase [Cerasicoccus arenae]MBK1859383.1 isoprenyl transferase [Cerasicoccus arenae]GHC10661.1 isoprenyl transferase [Cerasicoccus arenae]
MSPKGHNRLRHVAIIMDGNGRWARQRGLPRIEGHRRGVENVRQIIQVAREIELEHLTLFAFSVENWQRPPDEIASLMDLLELFLKRNIKDLIKNEVRLNVIGRPEELPDRVQKPLHKALEQTAHFTERQLNVALNYGSRTEVLDAVRAYAEAVREGKEDPRNLDWPHFENYLYTRGVPDPDLLIRTSGESRISNFLLMQCAYSELFFSPVFWPEFGREHFLKAIESYQQRERRFGKTGEQVQHPTDHAIANS